MKLHDIRTGLKVAFNLPRGGDWRMKVCEDGEILPVIAATAWLDQVEWATDEAGRKQIKTVKIWSRTPKAFDDYRSQPDTLAVIAVSKIPNDNQKRESKEFRRVIRVKVKDDLHEVTNHEGKVEYCATAEFVEYI